MAQNVFGAHMSYPLYSPRTLDRYGTGSQSARYEAATGYTLRPKMLHHMGPLTTGNTVPRRRQIYRGYLHPTQRYLTTYGGYGEDTEGSTLTAEEKNRMLSAGAVGLAMGGLLSFVVGPWVVKQFKPRWGYGKRWVTAFGSVMAFNLITGNFGNA